MRGDLRPLTGHAFARGLAQVRQICGGTQAHESRLAGVSRVTWLRWESKRQRAPLAKLAAVAERWAVSVDELVDGVDRGRLEQLELEQAILELAEQHGVEETRQAAARVLGE